MSAINWRTPWVFAGVIVFAVCWTFSGYILEGLTLIGDSDRLNAFLNVRKFEIDSIGNFGHVANWNDRIFMGNGVAGLHYMLPGVGLSALEAQLPIGSLFRAMTFVTALLVAASGVSAFLFIREVCKSDFTAAVSAIAYSLSVYVIHRSAQLDSSLAVLVVIPIGMLLVRKIDPKNMLTPFAGLLLVASLLIFFTFLQEAAYAFVLFGLYAIHRSIISKSIIPLVLFLIAAIVAIGIASPRVLTVLEDFRELDRTKDFQHTSWIEIYRFFAEGFFGRTQGEGKSIGNGTNLHEGLQLLGSSMAALLVVASAMYGRTWYERWTGFFLLVTLSMIVGGPLYRLYGFAHAKLGTHSIELAMLIVNFFIGIALFWYFRVHRKSAGEKSSEIFGTHSNEDGHEVAFSFFILTLVLCVVLVTEFRYLFYLLFFKVDFTHARFSIAALLPFCTLVAIALQRLMGSTNKDLIKPSVAIIFAAFLAGLFLVVLIESASIASWIESFGRRSIKIAWNRGLLVEVLRLLAWTAVMVVSFRLIRGTAKINSGHRKYYAAIFIGAVIVGESVSYAQFKLTGPHTLNHASPFENNNYMNASSGDLRPPDRAVDALYQQKLESEKYRSIFIAPPDKYPAFVAPHLANFWGLRVVDGYSAGVPRRLAKFDWPGDVRTLRSISFGSDAYVPWELLAHLNVKYAIYVDNEFYYNRLRNCLTALTAECNRYPKILENPFQPLPRHFFSANALPNTLPLTGDVSSKEPHPPQFVVGTATGDGSIALTWNAPWRNDLSFKVERRDAKHEWPANVASKYFPGMAKGMASISLDSSLRYIRIQLDHYAELSLAEVKVFGQPVRAGTDSGPQGLKDSASVIRQLAIGKPARQSSVANGAFANLAVDGKIPDKAGGGMSRTNREASPWWEVDLGDTYQVSRIELWGRSDSSSLKSFYVLGAREPLPEDFSVPTFRIIGQVGASGRSHLSSNLSPGQGYLLRVQSCLKGECSEYSDIVDVTSASPEISPPGDLRISKVGKNTLRLAWAADARASYSIERNHGEKSGFVEVARISDGSQELLLPYSHMDFADTLRMRACVEEECSAHSGVVSIFSLIASDSRKIEKRLPKLNLKENSFVEGLTSSRKNLSTSGHLKVQYKGDVISVDVSPSKQERFLVLNEMYHPRWKAFADGKELPIFPTNAVMRGIFVPPETTKISLRFIPFLYTGKAIFIMMLGIAVAAGFGIVFLRLQKRYRAS